MIADIYLDVQGFMGTHNEFIPKEIALVWNEHKYHHFLIKPPYSFQELSYKLKNKHHGRLQTYITCVGRKEMFHLIAYDS